MSFWTFVDPFERTKSQDLDARRLAVLTYVAISAFLYFVFEDKIMFNIMHIRVNFLSDSYVRPNRNYFLRVYSL